MIKKLGLLIVVLISIPLFAACSSSESSGSETLTMYIGVVEEQALRIAQEFEKDTGIKVNFVRMSGGEILGRVRAERDNPAADVWYGGPADSFVAAKAEGLLQPYKSPKAEVIPIEQKDPDGYWTGIYNEVLGFILDDRFFDERNIEKPKTWDDLLRAEYKNQIVIANPGSSGTAFLYLSGVIQDRGEEAGLAYMKGLDENIKQYTKSGSAPAMSAGLGEAAIGITFLHNGLRHIEEGFENISVVAPEDGTWYSTAAVGIIEGASNLEAAKKFIDWSLSKDAQEIGQQFGSYQFPTNPNAKVPEQAEAFKDVKLKAYDLEWSGQKRAELVAIWDREMKADKED